MIERYSRPKMKSVWSDKNKYDKLDKKFHDDVNKGYTIISNNKRFINIDASKSITYIHKKIINHLNFLI